MTLGCHYSVLKLSDGVVSGKISDAYTEIEMSWDDFAIQFEID